MSIAPAVRVVGFFGCRHRNARLSTRYALASGSLAFRRCLVGSAAINIDVMPSWRKNYGNAISKNLQMKAFSTPTRKPRDTGKPGSFGKRSDRNPRDKPGFSGNHPDRNSRFKPDGFGKRPDGNPRDKPGYSSKRPEFEKEPSECNSRKKFEDEHHLARSLSKFDIPYETQKEWERRMKSTERRWGKAPLELHPSPHYEREALQKIHSLSYGANVLIEIRDVRLPASTHNPNFSRLARHRLHLICYTHADLIDSATRDRIEEWSNRSWPGSRSIFVDAREHRSDVHFDLLYDSLMRHLETSGGNNCALTVGVANTGKSSLLMNMLRSARLRGLIPKKKLKATVNLTRKTGKKRQMKKSQAPGIQDKPGKTREITEYLVREKPRTFFLDVPGMTPPPFYFDERPGEWFGYAAVNLLPLSKGLANDPIAQTSICNYVLGCLNRDGNFGYVSKLGMKNPTPDITEVLSHVASRSGKKYESYALDEGKLRLRQCQTFLKLFNTGNFGSAVLDDIRRPYAPFVFKDHHFAKKNRPDHGNRHGEGGKLHVGGQFSDDYDGGFEDDDDDFGHYEDDEDDLDDTYFDENYDDSDDDDSDDDNFWDDSDDED